MSKFNYREPCFAMPHVKNRHRDHQLSTQFGLRRGIFEIEISRHMSPALIFDEFEERPFTENRRWRDSDLKIHGDPQTATDFVRVNAKETFVCRFGQPQQSHVSRQRLESPRAFIRDVHASVTQSRARQSEFIARATASELLNPRPRRCFALKLFLRRCFS